MEFECAINIYANYKTITLYRCKNSYSLQLCKNQQSAPVCIHNIYFCFNLFRAFIDIQRLLSHLYIFNYRDARNFLSVLAFASLEVTQQECNLV